MSSNEVSSLTEQLSKTSVEENTKLSYLGKGLKLNSKSDADEIVKDVSECKELKTLVLEGNTLGVEAAESIGKALEKQPHLQHALWSDMFTGRLKSEIPIALKHMCGGIRVAGAQLVELRLSDNAFGPNGMVGLVDFFESSACFRLKEISLHNTGVGITGGKMLAASLVKCYHSSVKANTPLALREFILGRSRLENEGAIALAEAFKLMGSLEVVQMPQNGIYHPGIAALSDAFKVNTNLKHLNLSDNTFTEKGATSMAGALKCLPNLEVVNFESCLTRTKGAITLARALKKGHYKLKEFNLSYNEISVKGIPVFVDAIKDKSDFQTLSVDGNQFGEEGIELLTEKLESCGKSDTLGSLSDDEGPDSEAEEEEDDDVVEISDTEESADLPEVVSAEDFFKSPSAASLCRLGTDPRNTVTEYLKDKTTDVDACLNAFVKVSCVVTRNDHKCQKVANTCADALFDNLLKSGDENVVSTFTNSLLVNLGILKSEDKKFKAPSDINGMLIVLEHVVKQKYFPKSARDILQVFLTKPHSQLEHTGNNLHTLLQTLYQF